MSYRTTLSMGIPTQANQHAYASVRAQRIHTPLQIPESMVIDFGTDNETARKNTHWLLLFCDYWETDLKAALLIVLENWAHHFIRWRSISPRLQPFNLKCAQNKAKMHAAHLTLPNNNLGRHKSQRRWGFKWKVDLYSGIKWERQPF